MKPIDSRKLSARLLNAGSLLGVTGLALAAQGCLDRPVAPIEPAGVVVVSTQVPVSGIDKIDLLIEVDNSLSMADKQSELSRRIPDMIFQLTQTNPKTSLPYVGDIHVGVITSSLGTYGDGVTATPNQVSGWSDVCAYQNSGQVQVLYGNDHGHLLPRDHNSCIDPTQCPTGSTDTGVAGLTGYEEVTAGTPTTAACPTITGGDGTLALHWAYQGTGYPTAVGAGVTFEADGNDVANSETLGLAASCIVASAKEFGCGYENNLEAAYHFLIDPHPFNVNSGIPALGNGGCYANQTGNCNIILSPPNNTTTGPIDGKNNYDTSDAPADDPVILTERANFLRPDSLLAVIFVSDENDVSLNPTSAGPLTWMPWTFLPGQMWRGTGGCAGVDDSNDYGYCNQNGVSCTWCETYTGDVCGSAAAQSDGNCKVPWPQVQSDTTPLYNQDRDSNNLRGWNQIQRFGFNFLWPRDRYVNGFTQSTVTDRFGNSDVNPIFAGGRTTDHVVVAAIVGVPDHLIPKENLTAGSTDCTGANAINCVPLSGDKWAQADWDTVVGPLGTRDPHMIESVGERNTTAGAAASPQFALGGYPAQAGIAEYKGYNTTTGAADLSADPIGMTGDPTVVQPNTGLTVPYNGNGGERHLIDFVVSSSDNSPSDGDFDDLQFSCMGQRSVTTASHDCSGNINWAWDPVCDCTGATCASSATAGTGGLWGDVDNGVTQPRYKAYQGLRYLRMIQSLGSSGYAASICAPSFEPAIIGIVNKIKSVLSAQCFSGSVQKLSDGSSNCIIVETIPQSAVKAPVGPIPTGTQGIPGLNACESLGLCTPGQAACNRSIASAFSTNQTPAQAAQQITLDISTGGSSVEKLTAELDPAGSGNVIIQPTSDAGALPPDLVCEVPQLTNSATSNDLDNCSTDPNYVLPATIPAGWCYANSATALAAYGCAAGTGELRFLGAVTTQGTGSELFTVCITQIGGDAQ